MPVRVGAVEDDPLLSGTILIATRGADRLDELFATMASHDRRPATATALQRIRQRERAHELHATVQNRLITAARRIEEARFAAPVIRAEKRELVALFDRLAAPTAAPDSVPEATFPAALASLIGRWQGLVTVNADIDVRVSELTTHEHGLLLQVVTEAVNNAVRHGHASVISVGVRIEPDAMTVQVDDDGIGPTRQPDGLGIALFSSVSRTPVTLTQRDEGGARVVLRIHRMEHS